MLGSMGGVRKKTLRLAALALFLMIGSVAEPVLATTATSGQHPILIVAGPSGSGATCSFSLPCTLDQAQANARARIPSMSSDIDVELEGGIYQLAGPLQLGPGDSGRNGFRVVYQAAPGQQPVLSGGRAISGWTPVAGSHGIWQAAIDFDTRQLYVDGGRVPLSQGLPSGTGFLQTPTGFVATSTVMDGWAHPTNVAAVFTHGDGAWTQTSCNIASISGQVITMAQPCWGNLHMPSLGVQELGWIDNPMGGMPGLSPTKTPNFFENVYSLMTPGTWSIDREAGEIYFAPPGGQDPNTESVIAPALQTLLNVNGSATQPVSDVTIEGIQFSYGGWTAPDGPDGFAQMQADWALTGPNASSSEGSCGYSVPPGSCPFASWTRTPANVVLTGAHDVVLSADTFSHLGGAGLDIYAGSQDNLVQGNEFADVAASAIQLGATNDPLPSDAGGGLGAQEVIDGNVISDNYIHDVANQYLGGVGIWLGYTKDTVVSHNQIDEVPYTAISVGWGGWHSNLLHADNDPNINADNVVSDNLIYDYMQGLGDGGAVYTNGSQATSYATALRISGNVAYDGTNTDFTFYTDAGSQYVYVTDNFDYYMPFDSFDTGGCQTVGHIVVSDNYFGNGGPSYPCFPYTDVTTSNNTTVCEDPPPSQAPVAIMQSAGLEAGFRSLLDRSGPIVKMVGPRELGLGGGQVLISGTGFDPGSTVRFGSEPASSVQVLSGNYIFATSPPLPAGPDNVTVTTGSGTSQTSSADQVTYESIPLPCVDYLGTGISTALFSS